MHKKPKGGTAHMGLASRVVDARANGSRVHLHSSSQRKNHGLPWVSGSLWALRALFRRLGRACDGSCRGTLRQGGNLTDSSMKTVELKRPEGPS